jgi:hypothetical protein
MKVHPKLSITAMAAMVASIGWVTPAVSAPGSACSVGIAESTVLLVEGESATIGLGSGACALTEDDIEVTGAKEDFTVSLSGVSVAVEALMDTKAEPDESIVVQVTYAGVVDSVTVTIQAQAAAPIIQVTLCERETGEDPMPWPLVVVLSHATPRPVQFTYGIFSGTAEARGDFTDLGNGTGQIAPGSFHTTIPVGIHTDQVIEGRESFTISILSASGATIAAGRCEVAIAANRT